MILESWESSTVPLREKHPNENYDNLGRFNRIKNLKREEPSANHRQFQYQMSKAK